MSFIDDGISSPPGTDVGRDMTGPKLASNYPSALIVAAGPSIATLVTGSVPALANLDVRIEEIVTGGTGGQELIQLRDPQPYYGGPGSFGTPLEAQRVKIFILKTKTGENDSVRIDPQFLDGDTWINYEDDGGIATTSGNAITPCGQLDSVNQAIMFVYTGSIWVVDDHLTIDSSAWTNIYARVPVNSGANSHPVLSDEAGSPVWHNDLGHYSNGEDLISGADPIALGPEIHSSSISSGGTGGVEHATLALPNQNFVGGRKRVVFVTPGPETLNVAAEGMLKEDGSALASVVLGNGDFALFEHWDHSHWRLIRTSGTAT